MSGNLKCINGRLSCINGNFSSKMTLIYLVLSACILLVYCHIIEEMIPSLIVFSLIS